MTMLAEPMSPAGLHKGAVLLAALGTDLAARVLSHMEEHSVEALIGEMTALGHVPAQKRDLVVEEFQQRMGRDAGLRVGGLDYARGLLEQAVGPEAAGRILRHAIPGAASEPEGPTLEEMLEQTAPDRLAGLMCEEHPQLVALLVSQLPVDRAAAFIGCLPPDLQAAVAGRLAMLEAPAPVALEHLERCLTEKLRSEAPETTGPRLDGPRRVADIMGRMRRSTEESLLSALAQQSPELAEQVNRHRFTFEDLLALDGRSLQRVLREIDTDTLRLAMKGLDEERQQAIFSNMSERAGARLREELENSGPVRVREVETAQQSMVATARILAEQGELQLKSNSDGGGEDDGFV